MSSLKTRADIQSLLTCSFDNYLLQTTSTSTPLAWSNEHLVGQIGMDYRMMSLSGIPIRVVGGIVIFVSVLHRSHGIGSELLNRDGVCFAKQ